MQDHSQLDTKPIHKPKRQSLNKLFVLTLIIGILMGVVITLAVGYGLYVFGYFDLTWEPGPEATEVVASPTRTMTPPVCPTCPPATPESKLLIVTATPEPTVTPDAGATATAACADFISQFPGTPCPSPVSP